MHVWFEFRTVYELKMASHKSKPIDIHKGSEDGSEDGSDGSECGGGDDDVRGFSFCGLLVVSCC